ncbi:hypothetical protein G7070_06775 [Propioniciclava coleopterorum]|uniref:PknH-like extracellular domain-containing protein n=1 Tax=Propioniciclava coleopterorum TaxID=2714937 RepID=A0A6G7Y559_9ACTN|nr:membrane lipoprotein lipid attachment site-containing protein [Propioniciclava coleopterorum]QIK72024.1 hypothetical protein G7070_06775 [Propioniciclava coleopterorum]
MKRIILAGVATLALTGCATSGPIATPSVPAPSPTPTVTASSTPARTATPSSTPKKTTAKPTNSVPTRTPTRTLPPETTDGVIAGAIGQVPQGFTLPDEGRAATGETTAFETTPWRVACLDEVGIAAPALDKLTATRIKASSGPEHVEGNGLLVFADDASAKAFMDQAAAAYAQCPAQGRTDDGGFRPSQKVDAVAGLGEQSIRIGSWWEYSDNGTWVQSPGADLTNLARKGRFVTLTYEGDESTGDPSANPDLTQRAEARIRQMLDQV